MKHRADCLVVGAGIIGCAIALQLQRSGQSVLLVDEASPGAGASAGNAGMVGSNAVVPVVTPGFLRQLPSLVTGEMRSVLIRPHAISGALRWLLSCQKMANLKQAIRSRDALHALHQHTLRDWASLLGEIAWQQHFRLGSTVSQHPAGSVMGGVSVTLRQQVQVATRALDPLTFQRYFPAIAKESSLFTTVDNTAAVKSSLGLIKALVSRFVAAGGQYERQQVQGFELHDAQVRRAVCEKGDLSAQHYILAAGIGSQKLLPPSGLTLPIMSERGYHIMLQRNEPLFIDGPCVLHDAGYKRVITEMAEGIRVTGYVEYVSPGQPARRDCYDRLEQHFRRRFPDYLTHRTGEWYGHRPSTPDSLPYIDYHPAANNLICAFGHGHYGMSGAPATARWVSEMVAGNADTTTLAPYRLQRFTYCPEDFPE